MNIRNLFKPSMGKMKAERDVRGLIDALKYKKDWGIRKHAAEALGELRDERAVEPLIQALEDENDHVPADMKSLLLGFVGPPDTSEKVKE